MIRHDPAAAAGVVAKTTGMVDPDFVMETYRVSPKYCAALPRSMRFHDEVCPDSPGTGIYFPADRGGRDLRPVAG